MNKIIRACTVPTTFSFVEGMLPELIRRYEVVLLSSPGSEMENVKARHGVKTIAIPMERHISLRRDLVALWRITKALRREKPQMIHSMTPKAGLLCMMAAWLAHVPVRVHTFTGLVWPTETGMKRRILMATDWLTCACATHIIPEGKGVMADLQNHGITKKPIKVLGYGNVRGIDLMYYSRERVVNSNLNHNSYGNDNEGVNGKGDKRFTFLFVGRVVRDKGINELVAAFDRLNKKVPETRLLLVGRFEEHLDPISEETRQMIGTNPDIEVVGEKLGDELLSYYAAADCFVMPSYREGFPNTVLEAGAMDLPCIVTDINGSREIVTGDNVNLNLNANPNVHVKKNGIVIPSKDEQALYEAMKRMLNDTEMRHRMAGNARRMIAERFDHYYVRQCLYDFYDEILQS